MGWPASPTDRGRAAPAAWLSQPDLFHQHKDFHQHKEMNDMYELTTATEMAALQSIADVTQLGRYHHHHRRYRSYRSNTCLVTANGSLNGISILNILNGFGGGW
jgi:hypothetical protein